MCAMEFDPLINVLNSVLNLRLANQNLISSNIANSDTPGFKAKNLEFESTLRDLLRFEEKTTVSLGHPRHILRTQNTKIRPEVYEDENAPASFDGNTVDRALEMQKLAENQILYDVSAELLKKKLALLKYTVTEGGGNR